MNLKNGKVFTNKFVWTGPSSYIKKKNLPGRGLTKVEKHCVKLFEHNPATFPLMLPALSLLQPPKNLNFPTTQTTCLFKKLAVA